MHYEGYQVIRGLVSPPVERIGLHPWLQPGWKILLTRKGYCSNTNYVRRLRCEDNNVDLMRVQPHGFAYGEIARRSS